MRGDEPTCAIPVSPVMVDLAALRTPLMERIDRLRFIAIIALSFAFHAAFFVRLEPSPAVMDPVEEAIPVEVIIEPPPPEPPKAEPEPEPAKPEPPPEPPKKVEQTFEEKPATDFARAVDQDREDGKADSQASAETPAPEPTAPEVDAPVDPVISEKAPEALPKPVQAKPTPRFAGFKPLPEFQFSAPAAKRSDHPSGSADPGYLSTLYGLIMRKMPALPHKTLPARGRVTFVILGNGRMTQASVAIPSGLPLLDNAALDAVRRASPYPPPPKGAPVSIRFDYGSD